MILNQKKSEEKKRKVIDGSALIAEIPGMEKFSISGLYSGVQGPWNRLKGYYINCFYLLSKCFNNLVNTLMAFYDRNVYMCISITF